MHTLVKMNPDDAGRTSTLRTRATKTALSIEDQRALFDAVKKLETQSFAMAIVNKAGIPIEALLRLVPTGAQASLHDAITKALERCLRVAIRAGRPGSLETVRNTMHTSAAGVTGAIGGFFGLPGLAVELPVTTTLMLHSIVEIARANGEDLSRPENALACLQVLALGPGGTAVDVIQGNYYASRAALTQVTREAAAHLTTHGLTREGNSVIVRFLARISTRFGIEVSEKAAAQLVPLAGAAGGMAINVIFTQHFQRIAEGHFTVRRLERIYGSELVRNEYDRLRAQS
jgi:NAD(P)-dependent dehydrogenase (short-subunit alcohol dehydrogenase family)